jgi:hypothetical protein
MRVARREKLVGYRQTRSLFQGARGLVFDQHLGGAVEVLLLVHRALERRIFEALA